MEEAALKILEQYEKVTKDTAQKLLNEVKKHSINYGAVSRHLRRIKASIRYNEGLKYDSLFDEMKKVLEEEMNDLPLTNRSE